MNLADYERDAQSAMKSHKVRTGQSETEIYNNCVKKYKETELHLQSLKQKREKLDSEIDHLEQKQLDRKNFITEVNQRHQKS